MTSNSRRARGRGQSEFRALSLFESLPPSHKTFLVTGDGADPHLKKDEYAVVDTDDRDPQHGELYLVQSSGGERPRSITQLRRDRLNITGPGARLSLVWFLRDLRGFRKTSKSISGVPLYGGLSDGPYETAGLLPMLIGRIIGVASSPLGGLLAPAAGFLNESAGNAAFDPVEYIDAFLAAGFGPAIVYDERRRPRFHIRVGERADWGAIEAVQIKFAEASTALKRVKQECIRRGLVDSPSGKAVQS